MDNQLDFYWHDLDVQNASCVPVLFTPIDCTQAYEMCHIYDQLVQNLRNVYKGQLFM